MFFVSSSKSHLKYYFSRIFFLNDKNPDLNNRLIIIIRMKIFIYIYFVCIFQMIIFNEMVSGLFIKSYDAVFFENSNYEGKLKKKVVYYLNFDNITLILSNTGKYFALNFKSKDCFHLPPQWKNRISSIFAKKCIILYTGPNCKTDKLKITLLKDKIYFGDNLNHPSNIPSKNFFDSS